MLKSFFLSTLLLFAVLTHGQSNDASLAKSSIRTGRIMKIFKDPAGNAPSPHMGQNRAPPPMPQSRRDRFPPGSQRPQLPPPPPPLAQAHYHPLNRQSGPPTYQVVRRVQNGPPPNTPLRPQLQPLPQLIKYDPGKGSRFVYNGKENGPPSNFGKVTYRPQFAGGHHPNALTPQGHPPQFPPNFKASPQYNGNAIIRPVSERQQFSGHSNELNGFPDIKQFPLPQQHPQHQTLQYSNDRPNANTAPQTFPALNPEPSKSLPTEALLQSQPNNEATGPQTYSVYEDPELNEHAPLQFNSQQNPLTYNPNGPSQPAAASREAEDYLKFMSTNEYFLPKFNPNYRKLDEEKDLRQQKLKQKQQFLYSKSPVTTDTTGAATFQHPIQVSQLYFHHDPLPGSAVVRGSYQAGNNAFVVRSDGNKAVKHIMPNTVPTQRTTAVAEDATYTQMRFNSLRHRTPEPIRFEFTERDAIHSGHTNSPPQQVNGHLRYNGISNANIISNNDTPVQQSPSTTPTTNVGHHNSISVNEVDADPEDGDDMQEAGTDIYGRIPIRNSSTESTLGEENGSSTTPAVEQKDTEEFCERMCANVQDDDEEIICGSDGYMYTGEAQMECYSSCLHIDVTIQGKGSCSAR